MTRFSDIPSNFGINPYTNDLILATEESAIRQSYRNLIMLSVSEKPFHPEVPLNLKGILFENPEPIFLSTARRNIFTGLNQYEPRAEVVDVIFAIPEDSNGINMTIYYRILNSQEVASIDFFFERLR